MIELLSGTSNFIDWILQGIDKNPELNAIAVIVTLGEAFISISSSIIKNFSLYNSKILVEKEQGSKSSFWKQGIYYIIDTVMFVGVYVLFIALLYSQSIIIDFTKNIEIREIYLLYSIILIVMLFLVYKRSKGLKEKSDLYNICKTIFWGTAILIIFGGLLFEINNEKIRLVIISNISILLSALFYYNCKYLNKYIDTTSKVLKIFLIFRVLFVAGDIAFYLLGIWELHIQVTFNIWFGISSVLYFYKNVFFKVDGDLKRVEMVQNGELSEKSIFTREEISYKKGFVEIKSIDNEYIILSEKNIESIHYTIYKPYKKRLHRRQWKYMDQVGQHSFNKRKTVHNKWIKFISNMENRREITMVLADNIKYMKRV